MLIAACLALAAFPALSQNSVLEVIPLNYRTAEQVIPVLKPLLDAQGSISGIQNQLVVRTSARNLADIKKVLATLDAMPRRLLITVRQDADSSREGFGAEASGRITAGSATTTLRSGGAGGGVVEARRGDDVIRGRVESTRSLDADRNTQTLQVLEGSSAFIRVGQSVPVRQVQRAVVDGQLVDRVIDGTEYRDVMSGFYALARLAGDQVTLEITPQTDPLARPEQNLPRGSVNVQRVATTVAGRLGEWIEVGGVIQAASTERSAILGSTRSTAAENRRVLLKVEEIR